MPILKAQIGRFDGALKSFPFNEGDNVQALLTKANLSLGSGDAVNNENGDAISVNSDAIAEEVYYIVGNYKQG